MMERSTAQYVWMKYRHGQQPFEECFGAVLEP
jgi:hypothetical protein